MNYEKELDNALNRIERAINYVVNQTARPICPTYPVSAKEMMRLALSGELRLGHYIG